MCYMIVSCWVYFNSKPSSFLINASAIECAENTIKKNGVGMTVTYQNVTYNRSGVFKFKKIFLITPKHKPNFIIKQFITKNLDIYNIRPMKI